MIAGRSDGEVRTRIQSGALAWSKVQGVMDRPISKKLKWKVLGTCVVAACIYGLETMQALSGAQQQRLQVYENNRMRRIAGVK